MEGTCTQIFPQEDCSNNALGNLFLVYKMKSHDDAWCSSYTDSRSAVDIRMRKWIWSHDECVIKGLFFYSSQFLLGRVACHAFILTFEKSWHNFSCSSIKKTRKKNYMSQLDYIKNSRNARSVQDASYRQLFLCKAVVTSFFWKILRTRARARQRN